MARQRRAGHGDAEGHADLAGRGAESRAQPRAVRRQGRHVEIVREDRMMGVVRAGHPLLTGEVTAERLAAADHLIVSRRGKLHGPVDTALAELGLRRRVTGTVGTFPSSLFVLRETDLVGLIGSWGMPLADTLGLVPFEIPLSLPPLRLGLAWHPRHDADPAHAWLRATVRELLFS